MKVFFCTMSFFVKKNITDICYPKKKTFLLVAQKGNIIFKTTILQKKIFLHKLHNVIGEHIYIYIYFLIYLLYQTKLTLPVQKYYIWYFFSFWLLCPKQRVLFANGFFFSLWDFPVRLLDAHLGTGYVPQSLTPQPPTCPFLAPGVACKKDFIVPGRKYLGVPRGPPLLRRGRELISVHYQGVWCTQQGPACSASFKSQAGYNKHFQMWIVWVSSWGVGWMSCFSGQKIRFLECWCTCFQGVRQLHCLFFLLWQSWEIVPIFILIQLFFASLFDSLTDSLTHWHGRTHSPTAARTAALLSSFCRHLLMDESIMQYSMLF